MVQLIGMYKINVMLHEFERICDNIFNFFLLIWLNIIFSFVCCCLKVIDLDVIAFTVYISIVVEKNRAVAGERKNCLEKWNSNVYFTLNPI